MPTGTAEEPRGQGGLKQQGIRRQNEAANALAFARFHVEHSPETTARDNLNSFKDPDFRIEGRIFDCYSPVAKYPRNPRIEFFANAGDKPPVLSRRARELLALYTFARIEQREAGTFDEYDDSIADTRYHERFSEALKDFMLAKIHVEIREKVKSGQARNIVLNLADSICSPAEVRDFITQSPIEKLECLLTVMPKPGARPRETFRSGDESYGIFGPEDIAIDEFEFAPGAAPLPERPAPGAPGVTPAASAIPAGAGTAAGSGGAGTSGEAG
ncbi:hypothetical protein OPKNFCMD_1300 [Methylobacterium crusticola]|uniref:Uncharacterized protein n=1 Tax=Methylobacterium crusticola TaxID=1697972 RepID=A0ABQ4QTC7_9HYPH|nr:hypothetical protein [Methylobacterium crusticola]GJD48578.1 hypothetical protein OPKNFCMD_1300 [Methylobacterium crusticola]